MEDSERRERETEKKKKQNTKISPGLGEGRKASGASGRKERRATPGRNGKVMCPWTEDTGTCRLSPVPLLGREQHRAEGAAQTERWSSRG